MSSIPELHWPLATRRHAVAVTALTPFLSIGRARAAMTSQDMDADFQFLSENGNSNCSAAFLDSIPAMPDAARIMGSCCGPMSAHRYAEQIAGLKAFSQIAAVPPNPYDIEAGLAKKLLAAYKIELTTGQQATYDAAFEVAKEGGPCCCQCWRWSVLGGMGKLVVRDHGFDAARLGALWDLANGCGGDDHAQ